MAGSEIDMRFRGDLQFLSNMLDKISRHPQVLASSDLSKYVHDAIASYEGTMQYLIPWFERQQDLSKQLSLLTAEPNDTLVANDSSRWRLRYEVIREAGGTPELINRIAEIEGMDSIMRTKILRTIFDLDLASAKQIVEL